MTRGEPSGAERSFERGDPPRGAAVQGAAVRVGQVRVKKLWLNDFRSYDSSQVELAPGVTVVVGKNGNGKTNLLEAIGYAGTSASFRGASPDVIIRAGCGCAVVRADVDQAGRDVLIEVEIATAGRGRIQVNKQKLARSRDLLAELPITVFAPDDLALVKDAPAGRRAFLDHTLAQLQPSNDALRAEVERILRQRNALLKQAGGRLTPDVETTLDVWDTQLADAGERLARARQSLTRALSPIVSAACIQLGGDSVEVELSYDAPWLAGGLGEALRESRSDDLRRGVSLVGPHRDELLIHLDGLRARTHASQGEQRTLALALRLGSHRLVTDHLGVAPVLLLDDVFSELDDARSDALLAHLPTRHSQTVLTTAGRVPPGAIPDLVLHVSRTPGSASAIVARR